VTSIRIIVPGQPIPKARPRLGKHGHVYTPSNTVAYEAAVGYYARQAMKGEQPYDCPFEVNLRFIFDPPASWSKTKQRQAVEGLVDCTVSSDIDNLIKAALDSANHIIYTDDRKVVKVTASKDYGPKAQTIIEFIPRIGKITKAEAA